MIRIPGHDRWCFGVAEQPFIGGGIRITTTTTTITSSFDFFTAAAAAAIATMAFRYRSLSRAEPAIRIARLVRPRRPTAPGAETHEQKRRDGEDDDNESRCYSDANYRALGKARFAPVVVVVVVVAVMAYRTVILLPEEHVTGLWCHCECSISRLKQTSDMFVLFFPFSSPGLDCRRRCTSSRSWLLVVEMMPSYYTEVGVANCPGRGSAGEDPFFLKIPQ
jgi:hypothetical protein